MMEQFCTLNVVWRWLYECTYVIKFHAHTHVGPYTSTCKNWQNLTKASSTINFLYGQSIMVTLRYCLWGKQDEWYMKTLPYLETSCKS